MTKYYKQIVLGYERKEYSSISPSLATRNMVKKRLLEKKDDEQTSHECEWCHKEFNEISLRVGFRIPLTIGGGLVEDNFTLYCIKCSEWKMQLDKRVTKFFKEQHLIGGRKYWCWNNIRLKQLHDYYGQTIRLWREADLIINDGDDVEVQSKNE